MTLRIARLGWIVAPLCVLIAGAGVYLRVIDGTGGAMSYPDLCAALLAPWGGALILTRQPRNPVGWIFVLSGIFSALVIFSSQYAIRAGRIDPDSLPLGAWMAWLAGWTWVPSVAFMGVFLPLLFPTGRLKSPRWRPVAWAAGLIIGSSVLGLALLPSSVVRSSGFSNPLGIRALAPAAAAVYGLIGVGGPLLMVIAIVSVVMRGKDATGEERAQMRWFTFGLGLLIVGILVKGFTNLDLLSAAGVVSFAGCVAVAMLKYRLYDIDRIISRTLSYATVTAVLGALYFGLVLLVSVVSPLAADSPVVVAISTLLVAAAFGPVRRRIQSLVDRRFNRARYDAQRVLEDFGSRLRDAVDLELLTGELEGAVAVTMQPERVTLWLKDPRS